MMSDFSYLCVKLEIAMWNNPTTANDNDWLLKEKI